MTCDVLELLNKQVNHEFYSAYLYTDFACFFAANGLKGYAKWFNLQAREELTHGELILKYILDSDKDIVWTDIQRPMWNASDAKNCGMVLEAALRHEKYITELINNIYECAADAGDLRATNFLEWFIEEQAEEEKNAGEMLREFNMYGSSPAGMYMLDMQAGKRERAKPDMEL